MPFYSEIYSFVCLHSTLELMGIGAAVSNYPGAQWKNKQNTWKTSQTYECQLDKGRFPCQTTSKYWKETCKQISR